MYHLEGKAVCQGRWTWSYLLYVCSGAGGHWGPHLGCNGRMAPCRRKLGLGPEGSIEGLFEGGQNIVLAAALEDMEKRNKRLDMECNRLRVEAVRAAG